MSASYASSSEVNLKKYDVVNTLVLKYGLQRFLEISTPTTGFTFRNIDTSGLKTAHRYIYNSPEHSDDEQGTSFRSGLETSAALLRALARPGSPERPYDCIFVDPFHTYRSSAIDLAGAYALLAEGGAIVVHDCNPTSAALALPTFVKGPWCGVTYAAFIDFVLRRGGITYYTVDCDHGCGVILKRPAVASSKAVDQERDHLAFEWEACRADEAAQFLLFQRHRAALLNLISAEDFVAREAFAREAGAGGGAAPGRVAVAAPVRAVVAGAKAAAVADRAPVRRWWESRTVMRHVNRMICGKAVDGTAAGDVERLKALSGGVPFARALSISGGNVQNEIRLLQAGVVKEFVLFETSELRAAGARHRAENAGVGRRLTIQLGDALAGPAEAGCQLVYWKDSLQRVPDVTAAIAWSRTALEGGGVFFASGYVGESRRQYTERQLDLAARARAALPERYLRDPGAPGSMLPLRPSRPDAGSLQRSDPLDCPDTGAILQAVRTAFPQSCVTPMGGVVYLLALSDVLANMDEVADEAILRAMLFADELCIEAGETLYATMDARVAGRSG